MLALIAVAVFAALLLAGYAQDWRRLVGRPRLVAPAAPPAGAPLVSVLIPARNEERSIGRCVAGALAQRYPRLEVLVLDDGSTDGTAAALAAFAGDGRLRVLRGGPLPPGWVGKCNACQQLGAAAAGAWLLFLDADTAAEPDLVAALLDHAERRGLDLLSLFPFQELGTFWERAVLPPFLGLVAAIFPYWRMERPAARPGDVMAFGQCVLVRREAYRAIGGHGAVRGEVLEDVRLAQALRAAGCRVGIAEGPGLLRARMYHSGAEVVAGLAKHAAAGQRSGGARSWLAMARELALTFGPLWLLAWGAALLAGGAPAGWAALAPGGAALAGALALWGGRYRRLYGLGPLHGLLWPLGLLAYLLIAALGILRVLSGRGVVWKGRTYSG
jgi:GT2 family glycosyltransferase